MLRSRGSRASDRGSALIDDAGSASLEFLAAGVLLLVPLVYLVVTLASIEAAAFAGEGAARHASRIIAREGMEAGAALAAGSIGATAADFGIPASDISTRIVCAPDPDECDLPGSVVTVAVTVDVRLPLVPSALDVVVPLRVPVSASASARMSDFADVQESR